MSLLDQPILEREPTIDTSIDVDYVETVAVMAEYDDITQAANACLKMRANGYKRFDLHTPFPVHGIDKYIGIKPTILPWIVLCAGLTGLTVATILTHYTMGTYVPWLGQFSGYQYLISGKPLYSTPAYIPVMFELTILFSAFGAVFGLLLLCGLPMHYNPLLRSNRFRRVSDDRFFLVVEANDDKYDEVKTIQLLRETNPLSLERVED